VVEKLHITAARQENAFMLKSVDEAEP
jgi:hypothetical protein